MSASTWLIPLNIHHSLKLRNLTSSSNSSSAHLRNISSSLNSLTNSINGIEKNSIELTGTANAILKLLQSNEYKESTIGAMRILLFNHAKTCKEATNEDDCVLAYSICVTSERIMNQPWFNFDLFSFVSLDEMEKAEQIQETCQNIMKGIEERMDSEERNMISVFVESLDKIEEMECRARIEADKFVEALRVYAEYEEEEEEEWGDDIPLIDDYNRFKYNHSMLYSFNGKNGIFIEYPHRRMKPGGFWRQLWEEDDVFSVIRIFSASRDIGAIPFRSALPFLEGEEIDFEELDERWPNDPVFPHRNESKEQWCKDIVQLHKEWKIGNDEDEDLIKSIITSANDLFDGRIRIEGLFSDTNQEDLDDVSISNDLSILDDGDYLIDIMKIHSEIDNENEAKFIGVNKNMSIDESIIEHYTQILFLIHEMGYPIDWPSFRFTRNELIECYKRDILANKDELIFDEDFIIDFPEYIDDFIREFCIPQ